MTTSNACRPLTLFCAFMLFLSSALVVAMSSAAPARAATSEITSGSVTWGIKKSWRDYIGQGTTLSGGVTRLASGEYSWPVTSGRYDDATKTTILQLVGTARFQAYEKPDGTFTLDSTFADLEVEIGPSHQVIRGDYTGYKRDGGALEKLEHIELASVDVVASAYAADNGTSRWTKLATTAAGDPFTLYAEGTALDPLSVEYDGPGGVPALGEKLELDGAPAFGQDKSQRWLSNSAGTESSIFFKLAVYASTRAPVVHVVERMPKSGTYTDPDEYLVHALDSATLAEITTVTVPVDPGSRITKTAFDPATDTVFVATSSENRLAVLATVYDADTRTYGTPTEIASYAKLENSDVRAMVWNDVSQRLELGFPDGGEEVDHSKLMSVEQIDGTWTTTVRAITIERTSGLQDSQYYYGIFGLQTAVDSQTLASLRDGTLVTAGGRYYDQEGIERPVPAMRIDLVNDTSAVATPIPGATEQIPVEYDGVLQRVDGDYATVGRAANGAVLLSGSAFPGYYRRVDLAGSRAVVADPFRAFDLSQVGSTTVADPERGWDYALSATLSKVAVLTGTKRIATLGWDDMAVKYGGRNAFAVLPDGSLVAPVADPAKQVPTGTGRTAAAVGLQRLQLRGVAPTVSTQPADTTVALGRDDASGPATFDVAVTQPAGGTVRWQVKGAGDTKFADVPGATGTDLAVSATPEADGRRYRALVTNDFGTVSSREALLTVTYAPRLVQEAVGAAVTEGSDANFVTEAAASPSPTATWQRRVNGYWQDVAADDDNYAMSADAGKSSLTVLDTNVEQSGSLFRAKLRNNVGTTYGKAVKLTVNPKAAIPAGGLRLTGVAFDWTGSKELQAAPPFGGSNYFSAGISDGKEATYRATSGQVSIVQTTAGDTKPATYATRGAQTSGSVTQHVRLGGGTATVQRDGSAVVQWTGTWSVNFYGGLVPFWFTDPTLTVKADGTGTLTADLDGYGSSMADPSARTPLAEVPDVPVATFAGVEIDPSGAVTVQPAYAGVTTTVPADVTQQNRDVAGWGAWPQPFVDFHVKTGLSSYWYSSGGAADGKKPPAPFTVDFSGARAVPAKVASRTTITATSPAFGTRPVATVRVTAPGTTPSGRVTILSGTYRTSAVLKAGRATVALPGTRRPGTYLVGATYAGSATVSTSSGVVTYRVTKARPTLSASIPSRITRGATVSVPVRVAVPGNAGVRFAGAVALYDGSKRLRTVTVSSAGTLTLSRAQTGKLKSGKHRLRVVVRGTSNTAEVSSKRVTVRVSG